MATVPATLDSLLPTQSLHEDTPRLNVLLYGPPGVGKTVLAATAADDERTAPALLIEVEGGTLSISHRTEGIRKYPVTDYKEAMGALYRYFYDSDNLREGIPFKTVIVDSLTELAKRALTSVVQDAGRKNNVPEYADWNIWTNLMNQTITFFKDLPLHLICTALEDNIDGQILPAFPGKKIGPQLPGVFNTVGRLYTTSQPSPSGKGLVYVRKLLVQSDGRIMAKDRSDKKGLLSREVDEPTITKLLDRIDEGTALATASLNKQQTKGKANA